MAQRTMRRPSSSVPPAESSPSSVVGRVFRLLESFGDDLSPMTLSDLMRATGMPKTTVYRLANELVRRGVLERADGGYRLGLRLFELGELVPRMRALRNAAAPIMQELFESTRSMARLSVADGRDVVFIETLGTHGLSSPSSRIFPRAPAHATASGKALLAFGDAESVHQVIGRGLSRLTPFTITVVDVFLRELDMIRRYGFAIDREEARVGLTAVAAPIYTAGNHLVGALSVAGRVSILDPDRRAHLVQAAASRVGEAFALHDPREHFAEEFAS